jgi:hypothetical protein
MSSTVSQGGLGADVGVGWGGGVGVSITFGYTGDIRTWKTSS